MNTLNKGGRLKRKRYKHIYKKIVKDKYPMWQYYTGIHNVGEGDIKREESLSTSVMGDIGETLCKTKSGN